MVRKRASICEYGHKQYLSRANSERINQTIARLCLSLYFPETSRHATARANLSRVSTTKTCSSGFLGFIANGVSISVRIHYCASKKTARELDTHIQKDTKRTGPTRLTMSGQTIVRHLVTRAVHFSFAIPLNYAIGARTDEKRTSARANLSRFDARHGKTMHTQSAFSKHARSCRSFIIIRENGSRQRGRRRSPRKCNVANFRKTRAREMCTQKVTV